MAQLAAAGGCGDTLIVGVLHDIVEDTDITLSGLRKMGYSDYIVDAIDALTRRDPEVESYDEYLYRVSLYPLAVRVKIADVGHNLARWTGIWPGKTESDYLGIDLNEFENHELPKIFFRKPR